MAITRPRNLVTAESIIDLLSAINGPRFVTLTTKTEPAMVAGNPFGKGNIRKVSRVNGIVNWDYGRSVQNQQEREGQGKTFQAEPRKWGTRLQGLPFVAHTGKDGVFHLYLELKVEKSLEYHYEDLNGQTIPNDDVTPWLRPAGKSRQTTEKKVLLRDYRMDRIIGIAYKGTTYVIEGNLTLVQDIAAIRS